MEGFKIMDLATLLGLFGALSIILVTILIGDGDPGYFYNPPSVLIVFGGTLMVVLVKFSVQQSIGAFRVAGNAFKSKTPKPESIIPQIIEMATLARKEGVLALEKIEVENKFLKTGITMLIDGNSSEETRQMLSKDMQEINERHKWGALVFRAAGDVAPAMGMIGTLIGLVQMLSTMDDPNTIGPAMAVALLTTLYGAILANMVFIPLADKLTLRRVEESKINSICLDGVLAIQEGQHPRILESLLKLYVMPNKRDLADKPVEQKADTAAAP
jgi:chemotaxis protein MotA